MHRVFAVASSSGVAARWRARAPKCQPWQRPCLHLLGYEIHYAYKQLRHCWAVGSTLNGVIVCCCCLQAPDDEPVWRQVLQYEAEHKEPADAEPDSDLD